MKKLVKESLNEGLKDELITKLLDTVYSDDDPKRYDSNRKWLETLPEEELDSQLQDYYLYDINKK